MNCSFEKLHAKGKCLVESVEVEMKRENSAIEIDAILIEIKANGLL